VQGPAHRPRWADMLADAILKISEGALGRTDLIEQVSVTATLGFTPKGALVQATVS